MGLEIVYFLGAIVLLDALVYGTISYRHRDKLATRTGNAIVRDRYRRNET